MKISLIVAAGIAVVAAKKSKLTKADFQDANERALGMSVSDFDDIIFEKCGGKPAIPENATDLICWLGSQTSDSYVWCKTNCPIGWRPEKNSWTSCNLDHEKENRRAKWFRELGSCRQTCPDMGEALANLPSNVHIEHDVKKRWIWGEMPMMKFSCIDKRDQLTIKGRFQRLFHRIVHGYRKFSS